MGPAIARPRGWTATPTTGPTTTPATGPTTRVVETPETPEKVKEGLAAFDAVEKLLAEEYKKPIEKRDLASLIDEYKSIAVAKDSYLKPRIDGRVKFLELAIQQREEILALEKLVNDARQKQREYEMKRTQLEVDTTIKRATLAFAAQGVLTETLIFRAGPSTPKRYAVRDPETKKTNAYVQCPSGDVVLADYVGEYVGIHGKTTFDKNLSLDIVEAEMIIVLDENVKFPTPPKPTVKPLPKPTTKPAVRPRPKPEPKRRPTTKPAPKAKPRPPRPDTTPPKPKPKARPKPKPEPATKPTTRPTTKSARPLPPTGLPMVKPETQPAKGSVNEKEFE